MTINVISIVLSVVALLVSVTFARRQLRAARNSDSVAVVLELLGEFRDPEMREARGRVLTQLNDKTVGSTAGLAELPEDLRDGALRVSHFFDHVGLLVAHDLVPADPLVGFFGRGAMNCWDKLRPYILAERARRLQGGYASGEYVPYFEAFAPEDVARIESVRPPLNARKEPFYPWAIAVNLVCDATHGSHRHALSLPLALRILNENRHQVLGARENEDVRVLRVSVLGQSLVGLASDSGQRQVPTEAKWTIAGTGVVGQRYLWPESGSPGAYIDRHCHRSSSRNGVGGELLTHAANGPTAFGQSYRGGRRLLLTVARSFCGLRWFHRSPHVAGGHGGDLMLLV